MQVPHGHASRLSYAIIRTVKTIQRCQLKQHAWPNPQLLRRYLHPSRPLTLSAATARPVAHFEAVTAEFSKAGIPDEVIAKLVRIYPTYLRWPIEPKLQPTLQLWLKHLGSQELSRCLDKCPRLLLRTPQESDNVFLWMASIGINAERMQQKVPRVMATKLSEVQSTVQVIQQGLMLMNDQLLHFSSHMFTVLSPHLIVVLTLFRWLLSCWQYQWHRRRCKRSSWLAASGCSTETLLWSITVSPSFAKSSRVGSMRQRRL